MKRFAGGVVTAKPELEDYYQWVEPDRDITVYLKYEAVDRLQLQVLRAMDTGSPGETEVAGILLGRSEFREDRRLTFVDDFRPVRPKNQNGPYYAPSSARAGFKQAMAQCRKLATPGVVGYYRSHNRAGLFLSADDLQLIRRHFRGPENLFLLIKTLPNGTCTAGFFFWNHGRIRSEVTGSEAPLIPISLSAVETFDDAFEEPSAIEPSPHATVRGPRRSLILGVTLTSLLVAATFVIFRQRQTPVPEPLHGRDGPEVLVAAAKGEPQAPTPPPAPVSTPKASAPARPAHPQAALPLSMSGSATPHPGRSNGLSSLPRPEATSAESHVASESIIPASPTTPASPAGNPPNVAPPAPVDSTAPPVPAMPPPVDPNPVQSVVEAPKTDATPPAPAAPPVGHTFIGPQILHAVSPPIPRGVAPMITSPVQVDVAVTIDARGKVTGARIASTKGPAAGLLTIEAMKAAQLFHFQPAHEDGRNVDSSMVLTFRFAPTTK